MFDVCAVGHVTQDVIRVDGAVKKRMPGGAVYYASLALRRLGRTVAVVTKLAPEDAALLSEMRLEKIDVSCSNSAATTVFENLYDRAEPDRRIQRVTAVAEPFTPSDLGNLRARFFHLGPLTNRDLGPEMLKEASARGKVALDAQGLVRKIQGGQIRGVKPEGWAEWALCLELAVAAEIAAVAKLERDRGAFGVHGVSQLAQRRDDLISHVHLLAECPAVGRHRAVGDRGHADAARRHVPMVLGEGR